MEMKKIAKYKTLWKMNSTSEPLFVTGINGKPLKKFTIPKIRRTAGKVYLSPCYTNTREYSFIHDTLSECRLDVNCDLQSSWQFGDTKLIHNEGLEKNFASKRSEMRESGRNGRELEEHFCFLALRQKDVTEIYHNGISTKASSLRILGNPLLGIYIFRHVDVALNYAHSRSITVGSIIIFKVLFGKVKKIQPSLDKSKVSLDPSPNFDCHMSRNTPSLKDTIELQAYSSAVYLYEYNMLSKPVDKPRQCLPYAIVTVKFIGQKVDNGHFMTSLRSLPTGFPKRTGSAGKGVEEPTELMAMEGASAQVNCTYQTSGFNGLFWYQQRDGGAPVFLSYNVLDGLERRGHFSSFLRRSDAHSYLLLKELHMKDFASYLCAVIDTVTVRSFQLRQNSEATTPVRSCIS